MKKSIAFLPAFFIIAATSLLGSLAQAVTIDTVRVGDAGNAPDTRYNIPNHVSVSYAYNIGKYEVTAGQYTAFLNAVAATDTYGLYNTSMSDPAGWQGCNIQRSGSPGSYSYSVAADWANRPVNFVSYWDACRFANWLSNGQPTGLQDASTTEDGAYLLNGYNGANGGTIQRKAGWKWAVTSEDEWYKAAYYKGGGQNAGYWEYPTKSDTAPSNAGANGYTDPGNHANYYNGGYTIGSPYYRTIVGEFENSAGPYGTFDQGGNVWEWTERVFSVEGTDNRGIRGGSFGDGSSYERAYDYRSRNPYYEGNYYGFRVVESVPEPSSIIALLCGLGALAAFRRRR